MKIKYGALLAIVLVMPLAAYADSGPSATLYSDTRTKLYLDSMTCRNTFVTSFLGDVVSTINNATITSTLTGTDIPKIGTDFSSIQADTAAKNVTAIKNDITIYNQDAATANGDAKIAIQSTHDKNVRTTLLSDHSKLKTAYNHCNAAVTREIQKLEAAGQAIQHAQSMVNNLASHGANTTELNGTIHTAKIDFQAFETAVVNANNTAQLKAAFDSFCLFDGCVNGTNLHFAAKIAVDTDQSRLDLLSGKNNTASYQSLVSQGQNDIDGAQNILNTAGTGQFQGNQSSDMWTDIKSAANTIHQLQQIAIHGH